ncbi:conjugal transfer protein TraK [Novosphingobium sp. PC22D]|jgi:conjugal transfer pilus assembly protein TraK|uniref:Conjugal transfer protein TraK n=1 Tax=Novosphingobium indicum TaxID=462949 RepID=A0ABQ2JU54_9SPHN|nr:MULTISPECIES: type-F conjugative transfer system secretin TraK [Novosphingobium]PEQ10997.1 conjugal transfer protein TraK [Novosphingobium sp. PC22D]GGN55425.1 hypothetical protein GCM10011349_32060 [Novosphingobium indicum]
MTNVLGQCELVAGAALLSSLDCLAKRSLGAVILALGLLSSAPALADQTVSVADNGTVQCDASKQDLTRISLKDDEFASVSKVSSGNPNEDFSVVHEATRGDIYLSVPEGYVRTSLSFFGTTKKGFVYKFVCSVSGAEAKQVFVANAEINKPKREAMALKSGLPLDQQAVGLVRAMFEQKPAEGFEIHDRPHAPVNVGNLKVQLVSEYDGLLLAGKVLRIENTGSEPVLLGEDLIASRGAVAVSISNPSLAPGQATGAYVVVPAGEL